MFSLASVAFETVCAEDNIYQAMIYEYVAAFFMKDGSNTCYTQKMFHSSQFMPTDWPLQKAQVQFNNFFLQ